ncbi:hypothetical protein ACIQZB_35765 [Streptomyces sp. NPDC097727]|uniref:hypothetical protein n=1 Tax=Streptomyces sp. NPDC097727 TaxID=3366092 RepID=UPI00382936CE
MLVPSSVAEKTAEAVKIAARAGATTVPARVETSWYTSRSDEVLAALGGVTRHDLRAHTGARERLTRQGRPPRTHAKPLVRAKQQARTGAAAAPSAASLVAARASAAEAGPSHATPSR